MVEFLRCDKHNVFERSHARFPEAFYSFKRTNPFLLIRKHDRFHLPRQELETYTSESVPFFLKKVRQLRLPSSWNQLFWNNPKAIMVQHNPDRANVPYESDTNTSSNVSSSSSTQTAAEKACTEIMIDHTTSQKASSPKEAKAFELAHGSNNPEIVRPDRMSTSSAYIQSPPARRKATYQSQYGGNHNRNVCSPFPYPSHSYHPSQYIMNYHDAQYCEAPLLQSPLHIPVSVQVTHHYIHNTIIEPSQDAHNSYMTPEKVSGSQSIQSRPYPLESRLVSTDGKDAAPFTHISPENLHIMGQGSIGSLSVGSIPTLAQQPQRRGRRRRRGRGRRRARRKQQQSYQMQQQLHFENSDIQDVTGDFFRREKSLSFDSDVDNTLPSSIQEDSTCDEVTIPE